MPESHTAVRSKLAFWLGAAGVAWFVFALFIVPLIIGTYYQGLLLTMRVVAIVGALLGYKVAERKARSARCGPVSYRSIAIWAFVVSVLPSIFFASIAANDAPQPTSAFGVGVGASILSMALVLLIVVVQRNRTPKTV